MVELQFTLVALLYGADAARSDRISYHPCVSYGPREVVSYCRYLALIGQGQMDSKSLRTSAVQIKKNIAKLQKKVQTKEVKRALERAERKLRKRIAALGTDVSVPKRKPKPRSKVKPKFGFGDYEKYINSPEWSARKAEYYKNHHRECRSCGSDDRELHLHHRIYARIYEEDDVDLMPLCVECHQMLHLFQKTFDLCVEDATAMWLAVTNGTPQKKKIRAALRSFDFRGFKKMWPRRSQFSVLPAQILKKTIDCLVNNELTLRGDLIEEAEGLRKDIDFVRQTGIARHYDLKVDELIKKLEESER